MAPVYKNLYDTIRQEIKDKVYKEGDLLPSENDYCKILNITRPTVRQALAQLEVEGFIKKHKGKGSIVQSPKLGLGILSVSGTTSATGDRNLVTRVLKEPYESEWPDTISFLQLEQETDKGCVVLERIRSIKKAPVLFERTYFPLGFLDGFEKLDFRKNSLFELLRNIYGIEVKGGEQSFRAINANAQIAKLLSTKVGTPILHLDRKLSTNRPDFWFYSSLFCNTHNHFLFGTF